MSASPPWSGSTRLPSRPCITAAAACVAKGAGDQLLVAQGTSYGDFPNLTDLDGFSPVFPTVIESYDPADPRSLAQFRALLHLLAKTAVAHGA